MASDGRGGRSMEVSCLVEVSAMDSVSDWDF